LQAGLKVWVLTGDKMGTAIAIGKTAELIPKLADINEVGIESFLGEGDGRQEDIKLQEVMRLLRCANDACIAAEKVDRPSTVVINGEALRICLKFSDATKLFMQIADRCCSVICCRVTPLQKSLVVKLVKQEKGITALSIGDGANDVSMIQEAHVGVGIQGLEGSQAARSGDYAIRQFKHLRRLMAVHGRWNYLRFCGLTQFSLYKNFCLCSALMAYQLTNAYSGTSPFDSYLLMVFNIAFTSLGPIMYGLLEKDLEDVLIEQYPRAYELVRKDGYFSWRTAAGWTLSAMWHCFVCFYVCYMLMTETAIGGECGEDDISRQCQMGGLSTAGAQSITLIVILVNLKLLFESHLLNAPVLFCITGSMLFQGLFLTVLSGMLSFDPELFGVFDFMNASSTSWMVYIGCTVLAFLPDFVYAALKRNFFPNTAMVLAERLVKTGCCPVNSGNKVEMRRKSELFASRASSASKHDLESNRL